MSLPLAVIRRVEGIRSEDVRRTGEGDLGTDDYLGTAPEAVQNYAKNLGKTW
jgi:hypothetical protein